MMARSIRAAGDCPGGPLTVRVEARPDAPNDRRGPAATEIVSAVKQMIGLTVA
jgi:hypothetical protein